MQPQYPGYQPQPSYPESSQAVLVLILGICGLVVCGLLAPVAWVMGNKEIQAIDAGRRPPDQRGLAVGGKICGIIGSVLIVLSIVFIIFVIILSVASSSSS